jgi:hypothetical protein
MYSTWNSLFINLQISIHLLQIDNNNLIYFQCDRFGPGVSAVEREIQSKSLLGLVGRAIGRDGGGGRGPVGVSGAGHLRHRLHAAPPPCRPRPRIRRLPLMAHLWSAPFRS